MLFWITFSATLIAINMNIICKWTNSADIDVTFNYQIKIGLKVELMLKAFICACAQHEISIYCYYLTSLVSACFIINLMYYIIQICMTSNKCIYS